MTRGSFHNHTIFSDGRLTPEQLLHKFKVKKFTHLAVTDHDNTGAFPEVQLLAPEFGITVIPGLEFSTQFKSFPECHIIGLAIDFKNSALRDYENEILGGRRLRAEKIVRKMTALGIDLDEVELNDLYNNPSVGRPHIAAILVKRRLVGSIQEGFKKYLNPGKPLYHQKHQWSSERVIQFIHQLGGKAILAHPASFFEPSDVDELVAMGLDGLEVIHPLHKIKYTQVWRSYARKNNLIQSGGADYHGIEKSEDRDISRYYLEGQDVVNLLKQLEH